MITVAGVDGPEPAYHLPSPCGPAAQPDVRRKTMEKVKLFFRIYLLLLLMIHLTGCSPAKAEKMHQQIKIGMSVSEVLDILDKNEGRHQYLIKLCREENNCEEEMYKLTEFIKTTNGVINRKINYSSFEAKILVLFMGPGFLKNDFWVYFDSENKVKSTTPVKHWD